MGVSDLLGRPPSDQIEHLLEHLADGVVVVDLEGIIRFCNPAAARLFGVDTKVLTGRPFGFPLVAGETTLIDLLPPAETRVVEMRGVDFNWGGEQVYLVSLRDISERLELEKSREAGRRAELAARRWELTANSLGFARPSMALDELLRRFAEKLVPEIADWCAFLMLDRSPSGRIHKAVLRHRDDRAAESFGSPEKLLGAPLLEEWSFLAESLSTQTPRHFEIDAASPLPEELAELGGESFILLPWSFGGQGVGMAIFALNGTPFGGDRERLVGESYRLEDVLFARQLVELLGTHVDTVQLYQGMAAATQMRDELLAVVSHEMRSPVQAILSWSEVINRLGGGSEATRRAAESIRRNGLNLSRLIEDLLDLSSLRVDYMELNLEEVDLLEILRQAVEGTALQCENRGIGLTTDFGDLESVPMTADSRRLGQVFSNLLDNAAKFTHEGGRIEVRLRVEAEEVFVSVADNGAGISPGTLEGLFGRFVRGVSKRSQIKGLGIGLSIVRAVVELHGGRVWAESEGEGKGAVFWVALPLL